MREIILITLGLSSLIWADLSRVGDVVRDSSTGLEWQDDSIGSTLTWESAITHCEELSLDGGGWRLPTVNELVSLVDDSRASPAIDPVFQNTASGNYWSSTTYARTTYHAWYVYFSDGRQDVYYKYANYYVRCVRVGQ
ncbi:DUF1566 domain-containing protein [Sulfurovum sp.]|uniref:Lcl C-terminal domain-containing protein n=1 Tax=Sulfurovum sp. TaxID=1969726 RepID=UPI00345D36AC